MPPAFWWSALLRNDPHLESVLPPITAFLVEALEGLGSTSELHAIAEPLIGALESVPGAGRVAVFVCPGDDSLPLFVAGPSFDPAEIDAVCSIMQARKGAHAANQQLEAELQLPGQAPNRMRLFQLSVPSEVPGAIIVTVRDQDDDNQHTTFDAFMDQIVRIAGVVVEDRRLRSKLSEQQSWMEGLITAAPDAIIRISADGTILSFLGKASAMFGWQADEIVGQHVSRLMPRPHADRHDAYIDAYLETGERNLPDFGRRLQALRRTGEEFPVEIALSKLSVRGDVEFIGIVRDISMRVAREQEIAAMQEALDAAARQSSLGELAATIAHELNQPLTAIANYMDALELRLAAPSAENLDTARDIARKTASQARLGGEIVRRTRRMAMKGETEPAMDSFSDAVSEAVSLIAKAPRAAAARIEVRHEGDREPALIDRIQIQQAVINLVSNALRAVAGREDALVHVITRQAAEELVLVVRDNGPGVTDADKARIFDRFFRRSDNGMGLGLAIVRRIANAHGGDVAVADAAGSGAEFSLTLPRRTR